MSEDKKRGRSIEHVWNVQLSCFSFAMMSMHVGANITHKSLIPASSWSEELGVEVSGHGSFVQGRVSDEYMYTEMPALYCTC